MKRLRLPLLVAAVTICLAITIPASAHALLLRSNPAANAILPRSPAQVELFFSETLVPGLSSITVLNANGGREDQGDVRVDPSDPTRITVSLPSLEDGVYTVSWTAVSAADGHQTLGSFTFGIGNVNASSLPAGTQTTSTSLPASALISKWLLLASLAILVGRFPFVHLVWVPALKSGAVDPAGPITRPSAWKWLTVAGLTGALVATFFGLLAQAGQSAGHPLALPWASQTVLLISTTRLGLIWLGRFAMGLALIWLIMSRQTAWKQWVGFGAAIGMLLTVSLGSHASTEAHPLLPILDDWLHLTGMSFWFGGLAFFLSGLFALGTLDMEARTRITSLSMERFSGMALASVGVIGLTGLYSASLRVGSFQALLNSIYGNTLLVKQIFVGVLLLLAATNLLFLSPRLKRSRVKGEANPSLTRWFRRTVTIEATLAGLLLIVVSILTYLPPAHVTPPTQELSASAKADDLVIHLTIAPGRIGQNTFTLRLTSNGQPVVTANRVLLRFTSQSANIAPSDAELIGRGDGTFVTQGTSLSLAGSWQVQAIIRRANKFDSYANFHFRVQAPGANTAATTTPRIAGILFLLMAAILVLIAIGLPFRWSDRFATGVIPFMAALVLGLYFLTMPLPKTTLQANPIPADQSSVARGEIVYTQNCAVCHGASGKGDGPRGLTLNPRPADLTLHGVPGIHTDAQLFDWITTGLPGTRMPAWKNSISDTDRWNLVNYLRFLAQSTPK
jgi:copper transport protein